MKNPKLNSLLVICLCVPMMTFAQDDGIKSLMESAEQGHADAQYNLGIMYYKGKGVAQNYAEAARWYRKAAERGHSLAQRNLGRMYDSGEGMPRDFAEAAKWYRKVADHGIADAQYYLGIRYYLGDGLPHSDSKAIRWFRKAAKKGHAKAQYFLGWMYAHGQGVHQDYVRAHMWFSVSTPNTTGDVHEDAVKNQEIVAGKMTPKQIAESQRLTREWMAKRK